MDSRERVREQREIQRDRATVGLVRNAIAIRPKTDEEWQAFKNKFVVGDKDKEEVFSSVVELCKAVEDNPDAIVCLSKLTGLASEGIFHNSQEVQRLF